MGLPIRDWFAGTALQGMLASETQAAGVWPPVPAGETWESLVAKQAYDYADAMMAARETETINEDTTRGCNE